jgi:malic enzyme
MNLVAIIEELVAAGVEFPPVRVDGKTLIPSQANNDYIFPAVGMAIDATQAKRVTDEMFIVAARACAEQVTRQQLAEGMLTNEAARSKVRRASSRWPADACAWAGVMPSL